MSELPRISLDRLDSPSVAADGASVSFRVRDAAGEGAEIVCRADDLERMIAYLAGLGGQAAARRQDVTPQFFGNTDRVLAEPIQTSDVGLARGLEDGEVILVARMFGFDLGFTVTQPQLAALHREIERALPRSALVKTDHHHHHHDH